MGTTRQAISHLYDECIKCDYRDGHDCTYKKRIKEKCVWYRKKKNGYTLEEPKLTKCPLKDEEKKEMHKKEVLDAISQEFQKSLQDIGATNAEALKAVFPNVIFEIEDDCPHVVDIALGGLVQSFHKDWLNAPYTESEERNESVEV